MDRVPSTGKRVNGYSDDQIADSVQNVAQTERPLARQCSTPTTPSDVEEAEVVFGYLTPNSP